uniref:Uncharacterized protein n=1 Tax=Alexandrium andersonii TaxID=327968 RepID=A0A7S2C0G9_9DINO|mmetsp:Transcript_32577/g.74183  ORF Transcript_32577/g.74183 Transcript_32577/m.74183 type:complete len:164 (+) Transcript_32577:41-532(+)
MSCALVDSACRAAGSSMTAALMTEPVESVALLQISRTVVSGVLRNTAAVQANITTAANITADAHGPVFRTHNMLVWFLVGVVMWALGGLYFVSAYIFGQGSSKAEAAGKQQQPAKDPKLSNDALTTKCPSRSPGGAAGLLASAGNREQAAQGVVTFVKVSGKQ